MLVNLRDIYAVRGHIAHGDPRMEPETIRMFTPYMEKRDSELGRSPTLDVSLKFGLCLYEAVHLLLRLLEKVFLNRFGARDSLYYLRSPYHTSIAP